MQRWLLSAISVEASAQLELPAVQPQAALPGQCDTRSQAGGSQGSLKGMDSMGA